ncbi:MAG TPA: aminotransferase class V-fold PLP-dependent enzyme [Methylomirabilota bacterium]|nr:aminotransferase class V-fold PLP-dependent enzyme [Methylomirabilota bacterium]
MTSGATASAHPGPAEWRRLWPLDPAVVFLNHGSYGACPRAVLDAQSRWRERMEREPVRFLSRELEGLLDEARAGLGAFLGADPADLAFVPNATTGVNTVLRSLELAPGDEILVTDHAYNACRNALDAVAARARGRVVVAPLPFPVDAPEQVLETVLARAGPRTRLALLDHVTSPTGLVLPLAPLVRTLEDRGIDVLVDGAHAPGMVPLALDRLGAAFYTGNGHKWLCAPKGAAFLHVRRDRQAGVRPLVISHGANSPRRDRSRFRLEFDWTGTGDPTPYLTLPEAIRYLGGLLPGGWQELMAHNRRTALGARARLCAALGVGLPAPDTMVGALAAIPVPRGFPAPTAPRVPDPLQAALFERFGVEALVFSWPSPAVRILRVSAQLYNTAADYERLAEGLAELRDAGGGAG